MKILKKLNKLFDSDKNIVEDNELEELKLEIKILEKEL